MSCGDPWSTSILSISAPSPTSSVPVPEQEEEDEEDCWKISIVGPAQPLAHSLDGTPLHLQHIHRRGTLTLTLSTASTFTRGISNPYPFHLQDIHRGDTYPYPPLKHIHRKDNRMHDTRRFNNGLAP